MRIRPVGLERWTRACVRLMALMGVLSLAVGCGSETDLDVYELNEPAEATFFNFVPKIPVFLGGCGVYGKEKLVDGEWTPHAPDLQCFWEGNAVPVPSGEVRTHPFRTQEVGTWRLTYAFGLGCSESVPLSRAECVFIGQVESNEYEVVETGFGEPVALCEETGGQWDLTSCGHWLCGEPPLCRALIPGCNCGPGQVFDDDQGCVADSVCGPAALCEQTGGQWDLGSCGHWFCGRPPLCLALIPGCNCGSGQVFDEEQGCVADSVCGPLPPCGFDSADKSACLLD